MVTAPHADRLRQRRLAAAVCYAITAVASVGMAALYLSSQSFMPYHAAALGMEWSQLAASQQILLLALMRVAGAGFLCLALVIACLLIWPYRAGERWASWLLPIAIMVVYLPTLWATLSVTLQTPAHAPWMGPGAALLSALIGRLLDPR